MNKNVPNKKTRAFLFFFANTVLLSSILIFVAQKNNAFNYLVWGDEPSYSMTLDESNKPSSLNTTEFIDGDSYCRYVLFEYEDAKLSSGSHVVLHEGGKLYNSATTRISGMTSIDVFFTGDATLAFGPTSTSQSTPVSLVSGVTVELTTNPYFFTIANANSSELTINAVTILFSCYHSESTIEFVSNGGTTVNCITQEHGTAVESPTDPENYGYVFDGWFTEQAFTNEYTFTTMPFDDVILYAKWAVDETIVPLTISEFNALSGEEQSQLQFVKGVVIIANDNMDLIVLADQTNTLILFGYQTASIGDEVRAGGYFSTGDGLIMMASKFGRAITIDIHAYSIGDILDPTILSVAQYNALNPDEPANWVLFSQINGTISVNMETHQVTLADGENSMPVVILSEDDLDYTSSYDGFRVNIRGVILPNMDDPEETVLMFLFNGSGDYIDLDYAGESGFNELKTLLEGMFRDHYEAPTYFPGQCLDLPANHPVADVTLSYETYGANASKYNITTKRFASDISVATGIDVHVNSVIIGTPYQFDIVLHVDPAIILTIAELRALSDSTSIARVIQGVVTNIQTSGENTVLLVADETGFVYVNTSNSAIAVGDEIIAVGYKITQNYLVFLYNNAAITVDQVISSGNSMPMSPTTISLTAFKALEIENVQNNIYYYELTGILTYLNPEHTMFKISDAGIDVYVYPVSADSLTTLTNYVNQDIVLRGIAIVGGEAPNQSIFLAFLPIGGTIAET